MQLAVLPPITKVPAEVVSRPEKAGRKVALTFDACSTLDRSFYAKARPGSIVVMHT